jgi:hypothetical protein
MTIISRAFGGKADDFALADAVAGDVDALAVDVDEAMADELAGLRAVCLPSRRGTRRCRGAARAGATGSHRSGPAGDGLFVRVAELALEDAVDVLRLLLLLQLGEVLAAGVAATGATVRAGGNGRRSRPCGPFVLEDVGAEAARDAHLSGRCNEPCRSGPATLRLTAAVVGTG